MGYMGRTPPWWGHTPPRHPRLGHRRRWAPCPKPIFSLHFHPRGKFLLFIQSNIHYKILILLYHLLRFAPFFSRTRFYIFFYFIKLKFKKSNCLPCLFFFFTVLLLFRDPQPQTVLKSVTVTCNVTLGLFLIFNYCLLLCVSENESHSMTQTSLSSKINQSMLSLITWTCLYMHY